MTWPDPQTSAILWAQWRGMWNRLPRRNAAQTVLSVVLQALWYFSFVVLSVVAAVVLPQVRDAGLLEKIVHGGLFLAFLYWQVVPILLVSTGIALDLKKVAVYPVSTARLFRIETLLRVSTGAEILVVMAGSAIGLWRNPLIPGWGPLALFPFVLFNMLLSVGVRDLLSRLLARKGVREIVVLVLVLISALPQVIILLFPPDKWGQLRGWKVPALFFPLPWTVTGRLVVGQHPAVSWMALGGWLVFAAWFGLAQFRKSLSFDIQERQATQTALATPSRAGSLRELLYRLPSRILPDPTGALVEKEFRFLSRAPRFRLLFFMGFSFSLMIWMPIVFGPKRPPGFFSENFLLLASLYSALLLGEVIFWNTFGFDRQAAQAYWVFPLSMKRVIAAKNIAGLTLLFLEVTLVAILCKALRVPMPAIKVAEAYAVTLLVGVFLTATGNLSSAYYPSAIDPSNSWRRSSSGRIQAFLILLYPMLSIPISFAYLARYAFDTEWAFFATLAVGLLIGWIYYRVALDSAAEVLEERKESILQALTQTGAPLG